MAVHPEIAKMLSARAALNLPPYHAGTAAQARQLHIAMQRALPPGRGGPVHRTEDHCVAVPDGRIRVRLFHPRPEPARGTILYLHGGGWVIGTVDTFEPICRALAAASGLAVASVDYRLAPEHAFPGPVDDAFAALTWLAGRSAGAPIAVMGDSAGATLAAACALKARDQHGPAIALQVLVYPVMDSDFDRASYREFGTGSYALTVADMQWYWNHYVPDPAMRRHPLATPLHAPDLSGLPPAIVVIAGCDPLRDEGMAFAKRLDEAGVPTTIDYFDNMIHGFFTMVDLLEPANAAIKRIGGDIAVRLRSGGIGP